MKLNNKQISNKTLALNVIKKMEMRGFKGYYCDSSKDAVDLVEQIIPSQSKVSFGGSETLNESGIKDLLKNGNYNFIDRTSAKTPEETRQLFAETTLSDYFFMSSNAITFDGQLVNIDGTGNRTSMLIHGPEYVVIIAGINKITSNIEMAINKARNIAAPPNAVRLSKDTPCNSLGFCGDCLVNDCICCNTVITRKSYRKDRIIVILINEELGY